MSRQVTWEGIEPLDLRLAGNGARELTMLVMKT